MKKLFLICIVLFVGITAFSQTQQVKGVVSSDTGEKLPGVNVVIKGTTRGTITDVNGNYTLKVEDASTTVLVYSFIGFESKKVSIKGRSQIDVKLKSSVSELDEIIAVGYGTMKKRDLTGSVSSVNTGEMEKIPTNSVATAIAGKVSGVHITSSEGSPDADITIRVRGGGSITQDNSPLYVIDGFPSDDGINYLDPTDIESIDILKDASSTAIYGARGANGVIIITTKGGSIGKSRISFDSYFGFKKIVNKMDVMDPYDFVMLQYENHDETDERESFENTYGAFSEIESLYKDRPGVDWQDVMFGETANVKNYKLSVDGGTNKTKYNFSFSRNDNEGIMVNSGYERNNARLKIDQKVNNFIDASVVASYMAQKIYGMGTSGETSYFNKMSHIICYRPTIGQNGNDEDLIYMDEDPALVDDSGNVQQNPLVSANAEHRQKEKKVTILNSSLSFHLMKGLTLKVDGGISYYNLRNESFDGERSITAKRTGAPFGSLGYSENNNWTYSAALNYKKSFKKNDLNILLGHEQVATKSKSFSAKVVGFPNDDIGLGDLGLGTPSSISSYESETRLISYFGRINYSFDDKYLFAATMRADGSSKFGPDNKYGFFPSGSAGWRISEEDFMANVKKISNLKLRFSYGVSGNNRIPNYGYMSVLGSETYGFNNTTQACIVPENLPNDELKWESTHSANLGIDLGLFDQRIQITTDFYRARTKDLLLAANIPYTTGFSSALKNIGETENKGMEFSIQSTNIKKRNFTWNSNFNISFNRNKVIELADGQKSMQESSGWDGNNLTESDYLIEVGKPIGQMYGYISEGMYRADDFDYDDSNNYTLKDGIASDPNEAARPGLMKYSDISGADGTPDGSIDSNDRQVIGNANPKFIGGLTNTFSYKNWDLSVFVNWSYGNDIYNANKLFYTRGFKKEKNVLAEVANRWTNIGSTGETVTDPAVLSEMNKDATGPAWDGTLITRFHSGAIEDGSFLRINNIALGYNLSKKIIKKINLSKLRIYATVNNIYTWTNYSGFDPEVSTKNSSGLTPGVDWGAYPRSRTFILGVNITM